VPDREEDLQMADKQALRCQQAPERVDKRNKVVYDDNNVSIDQPAQEVLGAPPVSDILRPVSEDCLFLKQVHKFISALEKQLIIGVASWLQG
jgi:hypothetical protein